MEKDALSKKIKKFIYFKKDKFKSHTNIGTRKTLTTFVACTFRKKERRKRLAFLKK